MEQADVTTARLGDFLSYARIRRPHPRPISGKSLIERIITLVADDFAGAGVELKSSLEDLCLLADPEMLTQILVNLVTNSLRSCSAADVVTVRLFGSGQSATIAVEDSGIGMTASELKQIFKPYFSRHHGGYGIGMAIVKRIVDDSDWDMSVESQPARGARVTISGIVVEGKNKAKGI